jgi:putative ABC transport system substrate-binding protein
MGPGAVLTVILTFALLAPPLTAGAQPAVKTPRIGLLDYGSLTARAPLWEAFRQGMRELGYVEGQSVVFEARGADAKEERLPALAAELVQLKVDVLVTAADLSARAATHATTMIPIVTAGGDPFATGRVATLARPGGNVTGLTSLSRQLSAKRLELARELVPGASRFAILGTETAVGTAFIRETQAAAQAIGVRLHVVRLRSPAELDAAFSTIARGRPAALLVIPITMLFGERQRLGELGVKHGLPTVYSLREHAEAGGLIAYGVKHTELFRRAAAYVDKILKGAKPGDLPIEQPTRFELVINLRTAKALGLTIPPALLARADELIQ